MSALLTCDVCGDPISKGFSVIAKMYPADGNPRITEDFCDHCFDTAFTDIIAMKHFVSMYVKRVFAHEKQNTFWSKLLWGEKNG